MEPRTPESIDRYRIEKVIEDGRLGPVYDAIDPEDGSHVAIEVVRATSSYASKWGGPDAAARASEHLHNELRLLTRMRHPNLVAVREVGFSADPPCVFVARELAPGSPLAEYLHNADRRTIVDVFIQLSRALDHVHALGLVHGHVDPRRIHVIEEDGRPRPKLPDVGSTLVAQAVLGDRTKSPPAAPEQGAGIRPDRRSDIYALASAVQAALLDVKLPNPTRVDPELWQSEELGDAAGPVVADALARMLDADPELRPRSVRSIVFELVRREAPEDLQGQDDEDERKELARVLLERVPFVDRGGHLAALLDRANVSLGRDGVDEHPVRTVLVEAPRGLGATTLVSELRRELRLRGRAFFEVGAWGEHGGLGAFSPLITQLAGAVSEQATKSFTSLVDIARERRSDTVEPQRIVDFLLACANERPYVLHFADLARGSELGRQVYDQLARAIAHFRAPMMLVISAEPHAKLAKVTDQLVKDGSVEIRTLRPFTRGDTWELVHGIFGDSPVLGPLSDLLDDLTGGHPLGLRETLRLLIEESILARAGNDWILHESRPAAGSLYEALAERTEARIDSIGVAAWELVATLHLVEEPIEESILAELAELRRTKFTRMLERLEVEGLITRTGGETDEISLAHRSAHEAVAKRYANSLDETRMDLASRIEELETDDPRLVFLRGKLMDEASNGLENVDTVEAIAEGLCRMEQAKLGATLLDRVIVRRRAHGGLEGASRLLATILTMMQQAGGAHDEPDEEAAHYHAGVLLAQLLGDHWAEATLWLGLADRFVGSTGENTARSLRMLERAAAAVARAKDRILELRIANRRAEILVNIGRIEESKEYSAKAMEMLSIDDAPPGDVCNVVGVRIRCLTFAGDFEEAIRLHDEIGRKVAARVPVVNRQSYLSGVALLASSTDPTSAIEELSTAVEELRQASALRLLRVPLHNLGDVHLRAEQFEKAAECFRETLGLAILHGSDYDIHLNRGFLGYTLARMGKVEEGAAMLREAKDGMHALAGEHFGYFQLRLLDSEVAHLQGDSTRARQELEEIAAEYSAGSLQSLASWARSALARIESDVDSQRSQSKRVRRDRSR